MRPHDLLQVLRAKPFEPFRVYVSDGAVYEAYHPEMAIVQRSMVIPGVPGAGRPRRPIERAVKLRPDAHH